jgi:tetracycline resistance efflux pump
MAETWLSLTPPLLVILIASWTRKINKGLVIGILTAGLIACDGSLTQAGALIGERIAEHFQDVDALYLYAFLFIIGSLIALLRYTGGAIAFAHEVTKKIRKKVTAETSTILLSFGLTIDDYLSILTNGYVMRTVMDRMHIPRVKLAYLIHSLSGPLVILVPISSWIAAITVYLDQAGVNLDGNQHTKILADPFFVYMQTIPFAFYSLLLITSVFFIVLARISYGPMYTYEHGHLAPSPEKTPEEYLDLPRGTTADLMLPIAILLLTVFIGFPYAGGYSLFGGTRSLIEAFQNNDHTFSILCGGGFLALSIGIIFGLIRKKVFLSEVPHIIKEGILIMYSPIIMIILASIFGSMLKSDLLTGKYLAMLLLGKVSVSILPVMFFLVSLACAIFTGSAWGTFALIFSIAIPMLPSLFEIPTPALPEQINVLFPILGAIFSGSVCGDHISPLSETTVMSATSSGVTPLEHAYTQVAYALPVIFATACAFIVSGNLLSYPLWINSFISVCTGVMVCFTVIFALHWWWHRK